MIVDAAAGCVEVSSTKMSVRRRSYAGLDIKLPSLPSIDKKEDIAENDEKGESKFLGSCRMMVTVMVFLGFYHSYALRFNMSMALVCMTDNPADINNGTRLGTEEAEFDWSKNTQGVVLGSFFYGYIITQVLGGYLSDKVTTKI